MERAVGRGGRVPVSKMYNAGLIRVKGVESSRTSRVYFYRIAIVRCVHFYCKTIIGTCRNPPVQSTTPTWAEILQRCKTPRCFVTPAFPESYTLKEGLGVD